MRVTVLSSDLSHNALSRANLLAEILGRDFDVDLDGTAFGDIWAPARDREFHTVVQGARWPLYAPRATKLLREIRGDVVYAIKPLPTSYGVALMHRRRTGVPVILDIDDDELSFSAPTSITKPLRLAAQLASPNGRPWVKRTVALAPKADGITVASTGLQARFGGSVVHHAKDTARLRPSETARAHARRRLGFGDERVVMFMGTPRAHKGIEDAAEAVARMRHPARFVLVGADPSSPYVAQLARRYPEMQLFPPYRLNEVADYLEAADVVVVPQRMQPETMHQQPSKLLDAMALARPIVATAVADIPQILGEERGIVVPPGDVAAIAAGLDAVLANPPAAARMGAQAREWCVKYASYDAMQVVLGGVFARVARG